MLKIIRSRLEFIVDGSEKSVSIHPGMARLSCHSVNTRLIWTNKQGTSIITRRWDTNRERKSTVVGIANSGCCSRNLNQVLLRRQVSIPKDEPGIGVGRKQHSSAQRASDPTLIHPPIQALSVKHVTTVAQLSDRVVPFDAIPAHGTTHLALLISATIVWVHESWFCRLLQEIGVPYNG